MRHFMLVCGEKFFEKMNYLYHRVPNNLTGKYIMPLNELRKVYPKVYDEEIKKYEGRESLLKIKIPILNCLWNDVLHMTAVHPDKVKLALKDSGYLMKKSEWFKINPNLLDEENMIVYLYKSRLFNSKSSEFVPLRTNDLQKYSSIGTKTKEDFREEISHGRKPLLFHFVPHILYKGKIKISDLEVIEV